MTPRLYVIAISNPAAAAAAMMAYKRIPHRLVRLPPGFHPALVRAAGFRRWTVPALDLDGRRIQGSIEIARVLDELVAEPPLLPPDPLARARVEEAERWGESVLQPVPRRLFRWALLRDPRLRTWIARDVLRMPLPRLAGALAKPMVWKLSSVSEGSGERVREDLRRLPELLDRVDALIADGTIGGEAPNAADFQILASVRVLHEFENFGELVRGRPSEAPARRLFPDWAGPLPWTPVLS